MSTETIISEYNQKYNKLCADRDEKLKELYAERDKAIQATINNRNKNLFMIWIGGSLIIAGLSAIL